MGGPVLVREEHNDDPAAGRIGGIGKDVAGVSEGIPERRPVLAGPGPQTQPEPVARGADELGGLDMIATQWETEGGFASKGHDGDAVAGLEGLEIGPLSMGIGGILKEQDEVDGRAIGGKATTARKKTASTTTFIETRFGSVVWTMLGFVS
jgi:hypothetical protein